LILTRYGFAESCFFDLVFLPIPAPDGRYLGVLAEFTEITEKVLQRNRSEVSRSLLKNISKAIDLRDLWQVFVHTMKSNSRDFSYAVVYTMAQIHDAETFQLEASCNIESLQPYPSPTVVAALRRSSNDVVVLQITKNTLPSELAVSIPDVGPIDTAYVLPIVALDGVRILGVVVLGLNPRRAMNPSVRQFSESIRDMLFKSAALFSLPMEQRESKEISRALSQQLETMTLKAEASEQNFTRMLRDAPIGMCMHREDGHCVYVNDVCLELLGVSKIEFHKAAEVGLAWRDAVHDEDLEVVNQLWSSAVEKATTASAEFRVKAVPAPEVRWLEISVQQRHDTDGNLEYLYVWLRDISTRKQLAEQKLQDALETKRRSEVFIDMYELETNPMTLNLTNVFQDIPRDAKPTRSNLITRRWHFYFAAFG
jgi:PAS domain S-box-containing protein